MYWIHENLELILDRKIGPLKPEEEKEIQDIQNTLSNPTRLAVLSSLHNSPKTVAMLADELGISRPVIWRHLERLQRNKLTKESDRPLGEKKYKQEIYYENNFPILTKEDTAKLVPILKQIEDDVEKLVEKQAKKLEEALSQTTIDSKGYGFVDISPLISGQISAGPCYRALRSSSIYREPITYLWKVSGVEKGSFHPTTNTSREKGNQGQK
jgi:ArsR family transcriptional regulator